MDVNANRLPEMEGGFLLGRIIHLVYAVSSKSKVDILIFYEVRLTGLRLDRGSAHKIKRFENPEQRIVNTIKLLSKKRAVF